MELNEKQLEKVTGGMTDEMIIKIINEQYSQLPESIRSRIIDALNTYGKKAAKALAEKLIKNFDWAKSILKLFD